MKKQNTFFKQNYLVNSETQSSLSVSALNNNYGK